MIRQEVVLTPYQRRRLESWRRSPPDPRVGLRAACLLMSAQGAASAAIRQATGLSIDAVTDIRRRWRQFKLHSLRDRPRSGRPPKVTAVFRQRLREALDRGPQALGYAFTVWSIARLNAHLRYAAGVKIDDEWLRQLVHAEGFVFRRPKHTLKGRRDERKHAKAKKQLNRLKKRPSVRAPTSSSGSPTKPSSTSTRT